jgi:hypothetical protein
MEKGTGLYGYAHQAGASFDLTKDEYRNEKGRAKKEEVTSSDE